MAKKNTTKKDKLSPRGIITGDCLGKAYETVFAHAGKAGLVFADPPFNIGVDYGTGSADDSLTMHRYEQWLAGVIYSYTTLLRPGGAFWMHVPDRIAAFAYREMQNNGLNFINWTILYQKFGQHRWTNFVESKVHGLYFVKGPIEKRVWNVDDVVEPSLRLRIGDKRVNLSPRKGMRVMGDVWYGPNLGRVQGNNEERWAAHHNQLPEMYLARIIRATTNPGDVVIDPVCGSGTSVVVADALKRVGVGIERVPANAASARRRLKRGAVRDVNGNLWTDPL